ncbi:MAG: hypothetical protein A2Y70_06495 [Candidatus Aminicenantes bacterium RBG_13_64_14]|nr:MAG: hypothetical protein A2Y70_06495 [Candidatus Aminicenantes bacterium RBG_13_64_14]
MLKGRGSLRAADSELSPAAFPRFPGKRRLKPDSFGLEKKAGWRGAKVSKEKEAGLRRIPLQPALLL